MTPARVLLVRPNATEDALAAISKNMSSTSPPLGIMYLVSFLRSHGHEVLMLDDDCRKLSEPEWRDLLCSFRPTIVGLTMVSVAFRNSLEIAKAVKRYTDALVVIGGPHASATYKEVLQEYPLFDMVIRGEGEYPLLGLCNGDNLDEIGSLSYRKNGDIVHTVKTQRVHDLDSVPFPAFDQINLAHYVNPIYSLYGHPMAPIMTGRGCPYSCTFCASKVTFGLNVTYRSVDNVMKEIAWLRANHNAKAIQFFDDTFTLHRERVYKLCDALKSEKIPWSCNIKVNTVDYDMLAKMREAGCNLILAGVEAGNDDVLNSIKKRQKIPQVEQCFRDLRKLGIDSIASFIIGLPEDNAASIRNTIAIARRIRPTYSYFFPLVPYPGTEIYEDALKHKRLLFDRWENFTAPKYKNLAIRHPIFSPEEILSFVRHAYWNFYLRIGYVFQRPFLKFVTHAESRSRFLYLIRVFWTHFVRRPTYRSEGT